MENAFKNILGHAGNVVDAVALGGTARNIRNANAFDNYMQGGQYDQALELAVKNGAGNHAALAQQQIAKQQAQADEFDQNLVNLAAHLDSVPDQNQRMSTIQTMMPFYVQQGLIDEQDVPFIMQAAQTQGGLSALVGMNTAPQQQFDNRLAVREADQTDYSNQTNRMNAQSSRMNAKTARYKAKNPGAGGTITLRDGTVINTGDPRAQDYTQFKLGAEAMARAATGLPGIISANEQMQSLYDQGVRFGDNNRNKAATVAGSLPFVGDFSERMIGDDNRDLLVRAAASYESVLMPILSGAAVTPSEAQRTIRASIPQPGDSDAVLKAKAHHRQMTEAMIQAGVTGQPVNINALVASGARIESMESGGGESTPSPSAPDLSSMSDEELMRIANQGQ